MLSSKNRADEDSRRQRIRREMNSWPENITILSVLKLYLGSLTHHSYRKYLSSFMCVNMKCDYLDINMKCLRVIFFIAKYFFQRFLRLNTK